ncbi:MAG: archease [Aquificota bacterium]|nr:archease [Aquificota bacterium]
MFYETLDHIIADTGIRVRGKNLEEVFCKAILATFNEITDIEKVGVKEFHTVRAEAPIPFLLADTINRVLLLHETRGFVASECEVVEIGEDFAVVRLGGERFDPKRHTPKVVIKAATYHGLKVEREKDSYVAEVIFDI